MYFFLCRLLESEENNYVMDNRVTRTSPDYVMDNRINRTLQAQRKLYFALYFLDIVKISILFCLNHNP